MTAHSITKKYRWPVSKPSSTCKGCKQTKKNDQRVRNGMKCGECTYEDE